MGDEAEVVQCPFKRLFSVQHLASMKWGLSYKVKFNNIYLSMFLSVTYNSDHQ